MSAPLTHPDPSHEILTIPLVFLDFRPLCETHQPKSTRKSHKISNLQRLAKLTGVYPPSHLSTTFPKLDAHCTQGPFRTHTCTRKPSEINAIHHSSLYPPRYTQKRSSSETGRRAADQGGSFLLPATLTFTTHYPLRDRLPYTPIPSPSPNGASYAHIARTARYLGLPGLQDPGQAQSGPVCPQLPITDLPPDLSHPR